MAVLVTDVKSAADTFIATIADATTLAIFVKVNAFTGFPLLKVFSKILTDVAIIVVKKLGIKGEMTSPFICT